MGKKKKAAAENGNGDKGLNLATQKSLKEFGEKFPVGTEVAVLMGDGAGVGHPGVCIAKVGGAPGVGKDGGIEISIIMVEGDLPQYLPADQVRARQVERKRTKNPLRVVLTAAERIECGDRMADCQAKEIELLADMKAVCQRMKLDINAVRSESMSHGERLRTGYDTKPVDCEVIIDRDRGCATEIRLDTKEILSTRPLYPSEQPLPLQFAEGTAPAPDQGSGGQSQEPSNTPPAEPITDDEVAQAIEIIMETQRASTSVIQRRMKIHYNRAAQVMDVLQERGIVGPSRGEEPREILMQAPAPADETENNGQPPVEENPENPDNPAE